MANSLGRKAKTHNTLTQEPAQELLNTCSKFREPTKASRLFLPRCARARQNTCTLRSFAKPNTPCRCCSGLPRFDVGDRDADGVRVAVAGHAGAAAEHRLAEHGLAETRTIPPRLRSEVMNRPVKGSLRDSTKRSL